MTIQRSDASKIDGLVDLLAELYDQPFSGKERGRFRVSKKLLADLLGQRRIWPDELEAIERSLYQRGYVSVDMESYLVVLSQKTFANYRRVNEAAVSHARGAGEQTRDAADSERSPA